MSVDGTWKLTMVTPMGTQASTLTLASNDGALSGTMEGPQGTVPIEDGALDGAKATWNITAAQMGMKIAFSANVDGDKIAGEAELGAFGKATFDGTRG
jgi:hypothetical protein